MGPSAALEWTELFADRLAKLDDARAAQVSKALKQFMADTHYGKLNFEKVKGTDYCTIRVNRGDRIVLKRLGRNLYAVVDVGPHSYIYNKYG